MVLYAFAILSTSRQEGGSKTATVYGFVRATCLKSAKAAARNNLSHSSGWLLKVDSHTSTFFAYGVRTSPDKDHPSISPGS